MQRRWHHTVSDDLRKRAYAPRPRGRIYQEDLVAFQHLRYSRARAQAHFRDEGWELTFEEWIECWGDRLSASGTGPHDLCLARRDTRDSWNVDNVCVMTRHEANQRRRRARKRS